MRKYITRSKRGGKFRYDLDGAQVDEATIARIASLAIPPAWANVEIALSERNKVQVTGYDANGKKQYIYSKQHVKKQDKAKFDKVIAFASNLPKLRKRVEKDLAHTKFDKKKVQAAAIRLMDEEYFRVGNQTYAKSNKSYGLTTLRSKHVEIHSHKIIFDFRGKSGQEHHKVVRDNKLARIIAKLDDMPGYELFRYYDDDGTLHNLNSNDVNSYIKDNMGGEFSAKDFRTWGGTMLAAAELAREMRPDSKANRKKSMTNCVKRVASKLGNTPAIARSSYIDPRIFEAYDNSDGIETVRSTMKNMKPRKYLSSDEQWVLKLLSK